MGAVGLSIHFIVSCPPPPPPHLSSLTSSLFEKALVEEMGATGKSLILQTEEQVPEIDARDALPCGSGAWWSRPTRQRGTCSRSLQDKGEGHKKGSVWHLLLAAAEVNDWIGLHVFTLTGYFLSFSQLNNNVNQYNISRLNKGEKFIARFWNQPEEIDFF